MKIGIQIRQTISAHIIYTTLSSDLIYQLYLCGMFQKLILRIDNRLVVLNNIFKISIFKIINYSWNLITII